MAIRKIYTVSELVNRLINRMSANSTITDYTPGSNIRTMFESMATFIEYLQYLVEEAYRSFYLDTATGEDLTNRVSDFGISRKEAKNAIGRITFLRNAPADSTFTIFSGIQISTQPDVFGNTITYELLNDVTFVSGDISASGEVICVFSGSEGNVPSGKITNITSSIPGVDSVINYEAVVDGASAETDSQLRTRVPIYINGLKKANEDAIKAAVLSIDGITLVGLKENSPINGYITVYVSNESGQLTQDQIEQVKEAAEGAAAFGIQTSVVTPFVEYITIELDATIDSTNYDTTIVKANIRKAIDEYIRTNPESKVLRYEIILSATTLGVDNIKNVKINGVQSDYSGTGDFVVVRLQDKDVDIKINEVT